MVVLLLLLLLILLIVLLLPWLPKPSQENKIAGSVEPEAESHKVVVVVDEGNGKQNAKDIGDKGDGQAGNCVTRRIWREPWGC